MITCYLVYTIDPDRVADFEEYGRRWMPLIEEYGGTHHGYWVPHESANDVGVALFSFPSLAAYETYRTKAWDDPRAQDLFELARRTGCIRRYERQFLRSLSRESDGVTA